MRSTQLRRYATVLLCASIVLLSGWTNRERFMSKEPKPTPMKTVCVGRFLLDIPATAEISFGSASVGGWEVSAPTKETEEEFSNRLAARESELRSMKNSLLLPSLEGVRDIRKDGLFGKVFMFDRVREHYIKSGKRVDVEAISYQSIIHSKGHSFELSADFRSDDQLERKTRVAGQLERWSFDQIPEGPGFCIGKAFVHEPLSIDDHEFVMMYVGMKDHPDLAIAISTWAGIDLEAPLLERERNNSVRREHSSHFKDLGTGERTINGIRGGQVADEVAELNGTVAYSFQWESVMEKSNVLRPRILLELDTGNGRPGKPVNSSFSKREVLALWNQISSSIRDRPSSSAAVAPSTNKEARPENEKGDSRW